MSAFSEKTLIPSCITPAYAFFAISEGLWSKQTQAGVIASVFMSSNKSSGETSLILRFKPSYSWRFMSSKSLVRKRTRFPGSRLIFFGGQLSDILSPKLFRWHNGITGSEIFLLLFTSKLSTNLQPFEIGFSLFIRLPFAE